MKILHTWIDEHEGWQEIAWAIPSRREIEECRKAGSGDVLEYCHPPRGWTFAEDGDTSGDAGNPGRYLIRV